MINTLFTYLLESTICLGIFYLFYIAVLHDQPTYRYNRFYLLASSLLSFIFPVLEIPLGMSGGAQGLSNTYKGYLLLGTAEVTQAGATASESLSWVLLCWGLYFVGFAVALFLFLKQLFRLYQIIQNGIAKSVAQAGYYIIHTNGQLPVSSFFHYLFWDNTRPMKFQEQQQILIHEEVHIQQKHSYDVLYISLLKIFFWFQPLVYLYDKALTETHEFAADAEVLKRVHPKEYARLLTHRLFEGLELSLVNHFYKSRTLKRIKMMELINKKTPWYKYVLIAPVVLSVFFTFSCQPDEEELNRQAIAQSYEDVQAQLRQVNEASRLIINKYYSDFNDFIKAAREQDSEMAALQGLASEVDLKKMEDLIIKRNQLQEKLMHLPDPDGIYTVVENAPEPTGGMKDFYSYIAKNLRYPSQARQMGIEGKVFVQFVVNEYGELTDFKTLKGIGAACDEEALRVLKNAPGWDPGTTDGKPVKVRMVMPITFKLASENNDPPQSSGSEKSSSLDKLSEASSRPLSEIVVVGYQQ